MTLVVVGFVALAAVMLVLHLVAQRNVARNAVEFQAAFYKQEKSYVTDLVRTERAAEAAVARARDLLDDTQQTQRTIEELLREVPRGRRNDP